MQLRALQPYFCATPTRRSYSSEHRYWSARARGQSDYSASQLTVLLSVPLFGSDRKEADVVDAKQV